MKFEVFSIFDSAVGTYASPFFLRSVPDAVRQFIRLVCDKGAAVFHHPKDYHLFHIATFDDSTGTFENKHTPVSIGSALEWRSSKQAKEYAAGAGIQLPESDIKPAE